MIVWFMKKIISALMFAAAGLGVLLTSCDIERLPKGSMTAGQITEEPSASLEGLLDGAYAQLKEWSDPMHRCGEYAGDNMMIRGASTDSFYEFITFSRTPNNSRLQKFWDAGYKAIAQASNIINMIDEGKDKDIDSKLGECYYIRGMLYFYLCRAYGRPYYQAPDKNLGVPVVNGTPEDMDNLVLPDRATVKRTYAQAIADLRKAADLITVNRGPAYASKGAAQAMLSRVYLYMSGTYANPNTQFADSARYFANEVILSGEYKLLDRENYMKSNTKTPEENTEAIFVVKRVASEFSGYDHYYGIGGMYANLGGMGWGEMYASAKYLGLLDEAGRNDWRPDRKKIVDARAVFIEPQYVKKEGQYTEVFRFIKNVYDAEGAVVNFNYVQARLTKDGDRYSCTEEVDGKTTTYPLTMVEGREEEQVFTIQYSDGRVYTGVIDYQISLNRVYPMFYVTKCSRENNDPSHLHSPIISRFSEMYLNRAEAYAKMGNIPAAMADINIVRERSIVGGSYTAEIFTTASAPELIDKERQLELAYQAERSYDVFRNGDPLVRHYPGPHRAMQDISASDFRVVYFIPQSAINAYPSGCTLTQNPTSDAGVVLK